MSMMGPEFSSLSSHVFIYSVHFCEINFKIFFWEEKSISNSLAKNQWMMNSTCTCSHKNWFSFDGLVVTRTTGLFKRFEVFYVRNLTKGLIVNDAPMTSEVGCKISNEACRVPSAFSFSSFILFYLFIRVPWTHIYIYIYILVIGPCVARFYEKTYKINV